MRNKKKLTALVLAAVLGMTSISLPTETVQAEEAVQEYVVYGEGASEAAIENYSEEDVSATTEEIALLENADVTVTELTAEEAEQLEEADTAYIVEENIWLEGNAKKKPHKKGKKQKIKEVSDEEVFDDDEEILDEEAVDAIQELAEEQWNRSAVAAEEIEPNSDGNIKIAILDSGVDVTDDIVIAERVDLINEESISYLCADMTGHGTGVASIINAKDNGKGTTGINEDLEIYSVKILDENNRAPLSRVLAALQWCRENDMDVVNMSFGTTTYSQILENAVKEAEAEGMLLVASAGNGDMAEYPAAFEEVLGVGSITADMTMDTDYANREDIKILAPGKYLPVTSQFGSVTIASGNSYAAPHVTAIAASLWNEVPEWSNKKIRDVLIAGAKDITENEEIQAGLVDYTYTKSILTDFEENYTETDVEEFIEEYENDTKIETYEIPAYVEANWSATKHANLMTEVTAEKSKDWQTAYSANKIQLLKQVSQMVDSAFVTVEGDTTMKKVPCFHAGGNTNYVAVTKYLYDLAIAQKMELSKSIATILNEIKSPVGMEPDDVALMKKAISIICNKKTYKTKNGDQTVVTVSYSSNQAGKNRALRILGIALHVAGDAYAHKAIVINDKEIIADIKKDPLITDKATVLAKIKAETMTTAALTKSCSNINAGNKKYADNTDFFEKRYTVGAKNATEQLLKGYYSKSAFKFKTFYHDKNKIKQYRLRTYVIQTNEGRVPSGVDWASISACD